MPQGTPSSVAIVDLAPHDQPVGLLEQAAGRRAHDQRRHQVFEHRARPGDQRRAVRRPASRRGRAGTSGGPARRPWRSRRSSRAAPRRRAGRSSSGRACPRHAIADRQQLAVADRTGSRSPSPAPSRARSSSSDDEPRRQRRGASRPIARDRARWLSIAPQRRLAPRTAGPRRVSSPRSIASARAMSTMVAACARELAQAVPRCRRRRRGARAAPIASVGERIVELTPASPSASGGRRAARPASSRARSSASAMPARRGAASRAAIAPLPAGVGERDQMAGQIAAVDRGDIARLERPQIARVVPVVEMAAEPLRAGPSSRASPPAARRSRSCRSSRNRGRLTTDSR